MVEPLGVRSVPVSGQARRAVLGVVAGVLLLIRSVAAAASPTVFVVPPELQHQVSFWQDIFASYSKLQVVVHDTERLDRVYHVLDFRSLAERETARLPRLMDDAVDREIERIRALLYRLQQMGAHPTGLSAAEQRIWKMFEADPDPRKFVKAAAGDRIRGQRGLKERFAAGIEIGHRYFPEMEALFRSEGVPPEVTRLALVESCFDVRAYSKAGAAGIWQFIPSTGRRFLQIDSLVDERRDPIKSTRGAARFLRENYERLGNWPLAINAYNHGPAGLARAVEQLGTRDIVTIIQEYRGPAFKFASRNFYPEFLAALEVERNHEAHFGPLRLQRPVPTDLIPLRHGVDLKTAAAWAGVDAAVVADLNPSLASSILSGARRIPSGFALRVPADSAERFQRRYAVAVTAPKQSPRSGPGRMAKAQAIVHRVKRGQTLHTIARKYGSTVNEIRRHNNIRGSMIREGQLLRIPRG